MFLNENHFKRQPLPHFQILVCDYGSFYGYGLKNFFIKSTFNWGWFSKIYVWLKLLLKLKLNKK